MKQLHEIYKDLADLYADLEEENNDLALQVNSIKADVLREIHYELSCLENVSFKIKDFQGNSVLVIDKKLWDNLLSDIKREDIEV